MGRKQKHTNNGDGNPSSDEKSSKKKKLRLKPGSMALKEIKRLQEKIDLIIPKLPFQRLVRDIARAESQEIRFSS